MPQGSIGSLQSVATDHIRVDKNGVSTIVANESKITSDSRESWVGSSIAGFNRRKRAGELLPFNSYAKYESLQLTNSCRWETRNQYGSGGSSVNDRYHYSNGHPGIMPLITDDNLNSYLSSYDARPLVQAAAAKIAASGWDGLTFVAELRSVYEMFVGVGKSLINLLRKGDVASTWLQYRYGWRTLYFDLLQIQETINSIDEKKTRWKERVDQQYLATYTTSFTLPWVSCTHTFGYIDTVTCGVRGLVVADIIPPKIQINPFVTALELVKFSFILEWFIQIGQWINAMSFLQLSERHYSAGAWQCVVERTLVGPTSQTFNPNWSLISQVWNQQHRRSLIVRSPLAVPLGITTRLSLDGFKVADLIALVLQSIRR